MAIKAIKIMNYTKTIHAHIYVGLRVTTRDYTPRFVYISLQRAMDTHDVYKPYFKRSVFHEGSKR